MAELVRLMEEKGLVCGLKVVGVVTLALVLREGILLLSWWLRYCTERHTLREAKGFHELVAFLMQVFELIQLVPRQGLTYVLSRERIRVPRLVRYYGSSRQLTFRGSPLIHGWNCYI